MPTAGYNGCELIRRMIVGRGKKLEETWSITDWGQRAREGVFIVVVAIPVQPPAVITFTPTSKCKSVS